MVDSSQIPARRSPPRTRRPRKLPLTNVLFIPRHGSCTPHSTNFITRVFPLRFYLCPFSLSFPLRFRFERAIYTLAYARGLTSRRKNGGRGTLLHDGRIISLRGPLPSSRASLPPWSPPFTPTATTLIFDIDLKEFATIAAMWSERKIAGCFCFKSNSTIVIIHRVNLVLGIFRRCGVYIYIVVRL